MFTNTGTQYANAHTCKSLLAATTNRRKSHCTFLSVTRHRAEQLQKKKEWSFSLIPRQSTHFIPFPYASGKWNLGKWADPRVCLCVSPRAPCVSRAGNNQSFGCANNSHMSENSEMIFSVPANLKSNLWKSLRSYKKEENIGKSFAIFFIV